MSPVSTNIKIDPTIKQQSQAVLESPGLSLSVAVNIFLRQVIREQAIPFRIGDARSIPTRTITITITMAAMRALMAAMVAFAAAMVALTAALVAAAAAFAAARAACAAHWLALAAAWVVFCAVLAVCAAVLTVFVVVLAACWAVLMVCFDDRSAVLMVWRAVRSEVFCTDRVVWMIRFSFSRAGRIAPYIRLSIEDSKVESLSIENQKSVLHRFADRMEGGGNAEVLEFVDNGYSGTNFERPAVQALLESVREGKINCIIVKDFTQFGRNSIEVGYFMEMVFPLYGVRFISINDDFDSANYHGDTGGLNVAFKYLIAEFYSRDLSVKSTTAKLVKVKRGGYSAISVSLRPWAVLT